MSFEIQELPDIIKIITLLALSKGKSMHKSLLKKRIDKICVSASYVCVEQGDIDMALNELISEELIIVKGDIVELTEQGVKLGIEWRSLLLKREPIIEVVAGVTDGSVTGLVVILSAFIAGLAMSTVVFAAFLTLAAVAITNFSSFFLGGRTEDLADMMTLQTLINYSLNDIPHKKERDKSLMLAKQLFALLQKEINSSNLYAAIICGVITFVTGSLPIMLYLLMPEPLNITVSLGIVGAVLGLFLVRYRSKRTKVHWKVTLLETLAIVGIAVVVSLLLGKT